MMTKNQGKLVTSTWFFGFYRGSLVGPCMQDCKSLCAAVMICATLVNIQTHTHTDSS